MAKKLDILFSEADSFFADKGKFRNENIAVVERNKEGNCEVDGLNETGCSFEHQLIPSPTVHFYADKRSRRFRRPSIFNESFSLT